ncbi:MAG: hypothetical protein ACR2HJ_06195 [Fimbriimonadales bacterium]
MSNGESAQNRYTDSQKQGQWPWPNGGVFDDRLAFGEYYKPDPSGPNVATQDARQRFLTAIQIAAPQVLDELQGDIYPRFLQSRREPAEASGHDVSVRGCDIIREEYVPKANPTPLDARSEALERRETARYKKWLKSPETLQKVKKGELILLAPDGNDKSHVAIGDVVNYFAKYLYLPRLKVPGLLLIAIQDGVKLLTWTQDSFAYADSYDETAGRYRGLVCGRLVSLGTDIPDGLLVRSDVALKQSNEEAPRPGSGDAGREASANGPAPGEGVSSGDSDDATKAKTQPTRYHGSVKLDPARVGRDASRVAEEVISHLSGLLGADVQVTLEIEARVLEGASEEVVRVVTQNSRDLKFESHGFED